MGMYWLCHKKKTPFGGCSQVYKAQTIMLARVSNFKMVSFNANLFCPENGGMFGGRQKEILMDAFLKHDL